MNMNVLWELIEKKDHQSALKISAEEYAKNPLNLENSIFLSSLMEEFDQIQVSDEILGKLLKNGFSYKDLLPLLFDIQKKFYQIRKSLQTLRRLKIYTYFDPSQTRLIEECLELNPDISQAPLADIVFYTGTPFLKPFCPDDLKKEGLGGSETAFVTMAKLLAQSGLKVVCFCNTSEIKKHVFNATASPGSK